MIEGIFDTANNKERVMDISIRNMSRQDMDTAVEWAAIEGWNPGMHDAEIFYNFDPDGFFMAYIGDKPVGAISAVTYGYTYGFIGFFIVLPEYRGHRAGIELGRTGMERLWDRNVGIDGVENKIKTYGQYGFKIAYNNVRFEGVASLEHFAGREVLDARDVPLGKIAAYDAKYFSLPREKFLARWIIQPEGAACCVEHDGNITGFGVMRPCRNGYKIGPLFADNERSAEEIFLSLVSKLKPGTPYYLDIPAVNRHALALVHKHNMNPVFKTARMYNREIPDIPVEGIYGVTSFELG